MTKRKTMNDTSDAPLSKKAKGDDAGVPALPSGPGGPMEIVFSFDTTGSMYRFTAEIKDNVVDMMERLQSDIPGLRMSVLAHGDYCDKDSSYITQYIDFTSDINKLVTFVKNVGGTGGGDTDECYELVLREVRTKLSWTPGTQRSLVMIGDANPHEVNYTMNTEKIDWKDEVDKLKQMEVRIYSVHCGNIAHTEKFYQSMATLTGGVYLKLDQIGNIFSLMMAICYREHGDEFFKAYEHEVRSRHHGVNHEMDAVLSTLRAPECLTPPSPISEPVAMPLASATAPDTSVTSSTITPTKIAPVIPRKLKNTKLTSPASRNMEKKYRESESKDGFALAKLDWSRWAKIMTKNKPMNRTSRNWVPRRQGAIGFRRKGLFKGDTRVPAVYEVAVKVPSSTKLHVTYFRSTQGFGSLNVDTYLLRHKNVTSQLDSVIKNGCDVYLRRARISGKISVDKKSMRNPKDIRNFLVKRYEYAWNKRLYGKRLCRLVVKKGISISSDLI